MDGIIPNSNSSAAPIIPQAAPAVQPVIQPAAQTPAPILGKFNSVEDLARSYQELERKLGSGQNNTTQAQPAQVPAVPGNLDISKYEQEYAQMGGLSAASVQELASRGISKDVIDNYVSARKTAAETQTSQVLAAVGGREAFDTMAKWASSALNAEDKQSLNRMLQSGDKAMAECAARELHRRFTDANGSGANLLQGGSLATGGGFADIKEALTAMSDPRYRTDAQFQNAFMARLNRSNLGIVQSNRHL